MKNSLGRIFLYNPQSTMYFGKSLYGLITASKLKGKYTFFQEFIKNGEICIFNDNISTSLAFNFIHKNKLLYNFFNKFEVFIWFLFFGFCKYNIQLKTKLFYI